MHAQAFAFVRRALEGRDLAGAAVLELGSYNVNGSVRPLFVERGIASYHGIDRREGPGVDEMADAAEYGARNKFDVVVTTEMLEHAPDPQACIQMAKRALKPGGLLIVTAAAPERQIHNNDGGSQLADKEHYGNIAPADLAEWVKWPIMMVQHEPAIGDVYMIAQKPAKE